MDGCSGKRAIGGLVVRRKECGLVPRESMSNRDKNVPICSRIGCGARINSAKGTLVGSADKVKSARPSFRPSSNGKEIAGSSSRTLTEAGSSRKPPRGTGRQQLSSKLDTDSSETSSVHDEPETLEPATPPGKTRRANGIRCKNINAREVMLTEAGSSCLTSRRATHRRFGFGTQDALAGPSVSLSTGSSSQATRGSLSRHGLRHLRCDSISDVVPSGSSSSDSSSTKKKGVFKKRNSDGESSSSNRGNKMVGPLVEGRNQNSTHVVSLSDSRRNRNSPTSRDNSAMSASTRRPAGYNGRTRHFGASVSPAILQQSPQPVILGDPKPSLSAESTFSPLNSYRRLGSSSGWLHSSEADPTRSLMNRDSFRHYNMDGIAEVLLALERIEQDEELTYEQLHVLETNLFLSGVSFYDQHRDMRLDIDNMSYEELLALEERMGTVSTALSEEALSESLKTSIYQSTTMVDETGGSCQNKDDVKCSICQEEYVDGDKVGRLHCEHRYHVGCIQQWLRMKNWCPICKTCAEQSSPPSPWPLPQPSH